VRFKVKGAGDAHPRRLKALAAAGGVPTLT